jgi:carbon-monoxide dehydrogenase small subunit
LKISFLINKRQVTINSSPGRRLVDILRMDLALTGTKESCGEGSCGSCLVLMNGNLVNSCLIPAFKLPDAEIVTIEGYAESKEYADLKQALDDSGAFPCGFCSSGIIMAAGNLLAENSSPTEAEIREALSGNTCRCGDYDNIIKGIMGVVRKPQSRRYGKTR